MDSTTPSKIQRVNRMTADSYSAFQMSYIKTNSYFFLITRGRKILNQSQFPERYRRQLLSQFVLWKQTRHALFPCVSVHLWVCARQRNSGPQIAMFVRVDFLHLTSSQPKLRRKSSRSFFRQLCPSLYLVWKIQRIFLRFSTHLSCNVIIVTYFISCFTC